MPYNDEVIQISGGLHDYVGKLDQTEHPLGKGWYRIHEPCLIFQREDPRTKSLQNVIAYICGPPGAKNYRKFVDIFIPPDAIMEVRVLDKEGQLFKVYKDEVERKPGKIITLNTGVLAN